MTQTVGVMRVQREPIRGAEFIVCPPCAKDGWRNRAKRAGAQDSCDVYCCEVAFCITRIPIGADREEWIDATAAL